MFFKPQPLRHKIIRLIATSQGMVYRSSDIKGFYLKLYILLFFQEYKSVILNELYYKGLIELHGDVTLFIRSKTASEAKHLTIAASLTAKGMVYYKLYIEEAGPELKPSQPVQSSQPAQRPKLSIVR